MNFNVVQSINRNQIFDFFKRNQVTITSVVLLVSSFALFALSQYLKNNRTIRATIKKRVIRKKKPPRPHRKKVISKSSSVEALKFPAKIEKKLVKIKAISKKNSVDDYLEKRCQPLIDEQQKPLEKSLKKTFKTLIKQNRMIEAFKLMNKVRSSLLDACPLESTSKNTLFAFEAQTTQEYIDTIESFNFLWTKEDKQQLYQKIIEKYTQNEQAFTLDDCLILLSHLEGQTYKDQLETVLSVGSKKEDSKAIFLKLLETQNPKVHNDAICEVLKSLFFGLEVYFESLRLGYSLELKSTPLLESDIQQFLSQTYPIDSTTQPKNVLLLLAKHCKNATTQKNIYNAIETLLQAPFLCSNFQVKWVKQHLEEAINFQNDTLESNNDSVSQEDNSIGKTILNALQIHIKNGKLNVHDAFTDYILDLVGKLDKGNLPKSIKETIESLVNDGLAYEAAALHTSFAFAFIASFHLYAPSQDVALLANAFSLSPLNSVQEFLDELSHFDFLFNQMERSKVLFNVFKTTYDELLKDQKELLLLLGHLEDDDYEKAMGVCFNDKKTNAQILSFITLQDQKKRKTAIEKALSTLTLNSWELCFKAAQLGYACDTQQVPSQNEVLSDYFLQGPMPKTNALLKFLRLSKNGKLNKHILKTAQNCQNDRSHYHDILLKLHVKEIEQTKGIVYD